MAAAQRFPVVTSERLRMPWALTHYYREAVRRGWVPEGRNGEQYVVAAALIALQGRTTQRARGIRPPYQRVFRQRLERYPTGVDWLALRLADWYLRQRDHWHSQGTAGVLGPLLPRVTLTLEESANDYAP